jgi:ADP-ribose pyrophosphatase
MKIERVSRELAHKGAIVDFYTDTMRFPDGHTAKWDHVSHNGAAAVVAVTPENKILMVRQYRNSLERMTLEIPAGGLDSLSEPPIICAARELEEETGYRSENLEFLISVKTAMHFPMKSRYLSCERF